MLLLLQLTAIWLKVRLGFTLVSVLPSFLFVGWKHLSAFAVLHTQLVYQNNFKLKCGCKNNALRASIF